MQKIDAKLINPLLKELQKKQLVWRAAHIEPDKQRISTGYQTLDKALSGGFPNAGLIHVKSLTGLGEMRLVLPAIKDKAQTQLCAFISAPFSLNAEFLLAEGLTLDNVIIIDTGELDTTELGATDHHTSRLSTTGLKANKKPTEQGLWSAEQCAKSGACAAVFIWHEKLHTAQAKKLELAAHKGQCLVFLFEANATNTANLPVSLTMSLKRSQDDNQALHIKVDKQKVGWPIPSFSVKVPIKAKMGSPMNRHRRPNFQAANVYALHSKRS